MSIYLVVLILSSIINVTLQVVSLNTIQQTVHIGEKQEILKLDEYGSVISQNLTYKDTKLKPCAAVRQNIQVKDYRFFNTLGNFQDSRISDGNDIIGMKILDYYINDTSAYLITDSGKLLHRWLDPERIQQTEKDIEIQKYTNETITDNKTFFALIKNKWLLLIQEKFQLILEIKLSGEIGDVYPQNNITFEGLLDVQVFEDFLFIVNDTSVHIYKLEDSQLKFMRDLQVINPVQIKIQGKNDKEGQLYMLENNSLKRFQIKIQDNQIDVDNQVPIEIEGVDFSQFDIQQNIIMVLEIKDRSSIIQGYQIIENSEQSKSFNKWVFEGQIRQVKVTQNFTIVVDEKSYYFLFHTTSKDEKYQQIDYRDLLDIEIIQHQNQSLLVGITREDIFTTQIIFHPISLFCNFDETQLLQTSRILMTYQLNSTDCPQKLEKGDFSELCQTQIDFDIRIKRPQIITFDNNFLLTIIILVFLISIWTCYIVGKCYGKHKSKKLRKDFVSFKEFERKLQKQTFDDINKIPNSSTSSNDPFKQPATLTHLEIEL